MAEWRVPDNFSASDGQCIASEIFDATFPCTSARQAWNVAKVNTGRFAEAFRTSEVALESTTRGDGDSADIDVNSVMNVITTACGVSMPKTAPKT